MIPADPDLRHILIVAAVWRRNHGEVEFLFPSTRAYMSTLCRSVRGDVTDQGALRLVRHYLSETFSLRPTADPQFVRLDRPVRAVVVATRLTRREIRWLEAPLWVKASSLKDDSTSFLRSAAAEFPRLLRSAPSNGRTLVSSPERCPLDIYD